MGAASFMAVVHLIIDVSVGSGVRPGGISLSFPPSVLIQ